jgi:predicted HicB family RNase H-like nuclease
MLVSYRDFIIELSFSAIVNAYYGEVINCRDVISFQASTRETIISAMHQEVDGYLENVADNFQLENLCKII